MTRTHSLLSPRFALVTLAAAALVGLALAAALATNEGARADGHATGGETLVVTPNEVNFQPASSPGGVRTSRVSAWIYGSGFNPGQSLLVLVADSRGVATDVGALSNVSVVANDDGAFGFKWTLGRFTRTGVGAEGMQSLRVVDAGSFDELATTPLALCHITRIADAEDAAAEAAEEAAAEPGNAALAKAAAEAAADVEAVKAAEVPSHCSA